MKPLEMSNFPSFLRWTKKRLKLFYAVKHTHFSISMFWLLLQWWWWCLMCLHSNSPLLFHFYMKITIYFVTVWYIFTVSMQSNINVTIGFVIFIVIHQCAWCCCCCYCWLVVVLLCVFLQCYLCNIVFWITFFFHSILERNNNRFQEEMTRF